MVKVLRGHQNWVYSSAFSPDSSIMCSVGAGKAVRKRVPSPRHSCFGLPANLCAIACDQLCSISLLMTKKTSCSSLPCHFHLKTNCTLSWWDELLKPRFCLVFCLHAELTCFIIQFRCKLQALHLFKFSPLFSFKTSSDPLKVLHSYKRISSCISAAP